MTKRVGTSTTLPEGHREEPETLPVQLNPLNPRDFFLIPEERIPLSPRRASGPLAGRASGRAGDPAQAIKRSEFT